MYIHVTAMKSSHLSCECLKLNQSGLRTNAHTFVISFCDYVELFNIYNM